MKVRQRTVAKLPRGYSIALLPTNGANELPAFLAGSEGDAELLLFEPPTFQPTIIAREPGGYISVAPLSRSGRRYAVATTEFKPGFNAAASAINLYPLDEGEFPTRTCVAVLPYTHRLATLQHAGRDWMLASTLCAAKTHKEDWTQPGGVHLAEIPANPAQPWTLRQIVTGLNKNHGFDFAQLGREHRAGYLLSAMEGLFFMPIPADPAGAWPVEQLDARENSDACTFDWDGDGEPEIFSISPFHGNVLSIHKCGSRGWTRTVIHDDLAFGHIVWAGDILGAPGLLAGSRRERRELRLYRPGPAGGANRSYELIDEGIGPSQIAVVARDRGAAVLFVAAHGQDEVRLYELEA